MNLVGPQVTQLSQALEALSLSRRLFPCRHYADHIQGRSRYFPRKLPLALEEDRATFVYVDPGRDTDLELLSWGAEHARLWAALRAQDHPVHVVAVTRDDLRRERATAPILQNRIRIDRGRTCRSGFQRNRGEGCGAPLGPRAPGPGWTLWTSWNHGLQRARKVPLTAMWRTAPGPCSTSVEPVRRSPGM